MNHPSGFPTTALLACAIAFFLNGEAAANQQQFQAVIAKHFLQNHHAIPLHNNGNVKSGDVLKMPDEATYLSRGKCYPLPPVRYTSLSSEYIRTSLIPKSQQTQEVAYRFRRSRKLRRKLAASCT